MITLETFYHGDIFEREWISGLIFCPLPLDSTTISYIFQKALSEAILERSLGIFLVNSTTCTILSKRIATPHGHFQKRIFLVQNQDEIFESCPRKYWFSYYGFWNGWLKDALKEPARFMS